MATQSQIDANRRNAQKSTGPTTPEGRAAVRHNALKHGLTAEILIPSMEEQPEFDRLCDAFETEYQPVGPTEESLLENLAAAKWRLSRARKAETGFFLKRSLDLEHESQDYRELPANGRLALIVDLDSAGPDTLAKISRYEARLERSFYKALTELRRTIPARTRRTTRCETDPIRGPAARTRPTTGSHRASSAAGTVRNPTSVCETDPIRRRDPRKPTSNNQHPTSL